MALGEVRKVEVLPSFWAASAGASGPMRPWPGGSTRPPRSRSKRQLARLASVRWDLHIGQRQRTTLWTERAYPHRILRWEDGDGGRGELMQTIRVPYWQLQANTDEGVSAEELGIP